jgi:hypothetical protein
MKRLTDTCFCASLQHSVCFLDFGLSRLSAPSGTEAHEELAALRRLFGCESGSSGEFRGE